MHPEDKRYADYKQGQKIDLEWINGPISATVIKDDAIDMEFGTGVMTITPWHDAVDFGIAERHNLDKEQIIDEKGKLLPIAGEFAGIHISKARPLIIEKLRSKGLVVKTEENYKHIVHTCYKCGTTIEPQIQNQWFVKTRPLADRALQAIRSEVKYYPEHFKKITEHWLENIIDWNISRQIVWGIPIPAKICDKCEDGYVDLDNKITHCKKCGGEVRQDKDTFDTWFSSSQWPFATLGYPASQDFKDFYPTQVMETAGDIFHWVARMIMLGLYVTDKLPFNTVYMHGMVLDAKGQKMSKSKGNVLSPLDLTAKFGTDAFRIGMVVGNTPGTSLALSDDKISAYKKFANKIWNVTRFVLSTAEGLGPKGEVVEGVKVVDYDVDFSLFNDVDQKLISEFDNIVKDITSDMDNFRYYLASEKIYHYFWHNFADVILEESKKVMTSGVESDILSRKQTLLHILVKSLKVLHPFMPFITEEIWASLPIPNKKLLMVEKWPA
jgi:valyl-tRNA synthetase